MNSSTIMNRLKSLVKSIPLVGQAARFVYFRWFKRPIKFRCSEDYWKRRYASGGASGAGSYNELAEFKAEILNDFVKSQAITSVIEYGCGDGNQVRLASYPSYLGYDVSRDAIRLCRRLLADDRLKEFRLLSDYHGETAELTISLDVIYHLIEDDVYETYMRRLFDSATNYVIIYSSNTDINPAGQAEHVRQRRFTVWIEDNEPEWVLLRYIPNRYPLDEANGSGSFADFYVFAKRLQPELSSH